MKPYHEDGLVKLYHGDCLDLLPGTPAGSVDLVYLDPPFNTGKDWSRGGATFSDRWGGMDAYIAFMRARAVELRRVLKPTGFLFLHCDHHAWAELGIMLDGVFGLENRRAKIAWKRKHAENSSKRFGRVHDTIWRFAKSEEAAENPGCVCERKFGECLCHTDLWLDLVPGRGFGRKRGTAYPTQKPLPLLERIVRLASPPGGSVLDPFMGSGTTLVAAAKFGRRAIGIDASVAACEVATRRLAGEAQPTLALEGAF